MPKGLAPKRKCESTFIRTMWDEKFCYNCTLGSDLMKNRAKNWPKCRECLDRFTNRKGKQ